MIGGSSLSGHTLVACHFPVVQLPTWQLPVQALCGSAKRPGRLCSAGLTRAVSLPEQDTRNHEHALTDARRHFSSSYCSLAEDRAEDEGASDSSGKYDCASSPEEASSHLTGDGGGARACLRSHNSFLPNAELEEDEADEDSDGDNLHRYHEDSSFVLHGNPHWQNNGAVNYALAHGDPDSEWGSEGTMLGTGGHPEWLSNQPGRVDSLRPECQCFDGSRPGTTVSSCVEQSADRLQDNVSCQRKCSSDLLSNSLTEYVSDSSCNSSDGVLVNFCTIYSKSNNPATPHDLSSPAVHPGHSSEGSVFLSLQPVPQSPSVHNGDAAAFSPPKEETDAGLSGSRCSARGLDSNCNHCSLEPLPPGMSSLEVSDLTACLQSQSALAVGTNQKYYKLVTCDLSSQSPSPAWSSLTSCPEGQGRSSPFLSPLDHKRGAQHSEVKQVRDDQEKEKAFSSVQSRAEFQSPHFLTIDYQVATTSNDKTFFWKQHTGGAQSMSHMPCSQYPNQCSDKCQDTSRASTQPSAVQDQEHNITDTVDVGVCSVEREVVHSSKPQRPTSLPIQPFVLIPIEKPQSQAQYLGCLLEQYINQKSSKHGESQPDPEFKVKRSKCLSNLQSPLMEGHCPIFLDAPSTSDSCSTCTPSPESFSHRHTWSQFSRNQGCPSTSKSTLDSHRTAVEPKNVLMQYTTSPTCNKTRSFNLISALNRSNLVKIPTHQDLIGLTSEQDGASAKPGSPGSSLTHSSYYPGSSHTPPTLPLTADADQPNLRVSLSPACSRPQQKLPQYHAPPAADSDFSSFTATLSSVAPLSCLSSLLSRAASGLLPHETRDSAGLGLKPHQHGESLILSDRPPNEFCLSPDTSYESMSISHLQRRGLLRSVSSAVDLIMAHFGSTRDPEEKMWLGNSSYSPTIAGLVLEHLCPAIQNILEDGLRDHKLDFIIGQRRNHAWSVVEISTRIGPSTRVLHSLVTKIRHCPQLTNHSMRLRAFIMGLLNLRALEFWLSHMQSQTDLVMAYYHSWGFLSMSLGQCQALFQELLLLLQPLSVLPFDLNLLLEARLERRRRLCSEEQGISPPQPCSALLVTGWPKLLNRKVQCCSTQPTQSSPHAGQQLHSLLNSSCPKLQYGGMQASRSPLAPIPEFLVKEPDQFDDVGEEVECMENHTDTWSQISMESRQEEKRSEKDCRTLNASTHAQAESPGQSGLRWAKLFGASDASSKAEKSSHSNGGSQTRRRPSQWLHLDRSHLGLLAQSIRSLKLGGAQPQTDC
ncbi:AP-4 complex accessory subunit RUSC2 [Menidia menidia]